MFQNLSVFQTAGQLARHSAARQVVVARNIANANTPGFKSQDIAGFRESMSQASGVTTGLRTSRADHIQGSTQVSSFAARDVKSTEQKPNGNTVFIETETLKSIEAERAHSRALAVYQSSLSLLKISIGRGR